MAAILEVSAAQYDTFFFFFLIYCVGFLPSRKSTVLMSSRSVLLVRAYV